MVCAVDHSHVGGGSRGLENDKIVSQVYYDPSSRTVTIPSGPGRGEYETPSGAAVAVVHALNPHVNPNRNGWSFWTVTATGQLLQSIR
jgi:hypothetical protein